jgi:hypothetical protein
VIEFIFGSLFGIALMIAVALHLASKDKPKVAERQPSVASISMNGTADADETFVQAVQRLVKGAETLH